MPVMVMQLEQPAVAWDLSSGISNVSAMVAKLREVWDHQTAEDLTQGKITVPDDFLNQSLTGMLADSDKVKDFSLTSLSDNRVKIHFRTESTGTVELVCQILQFEHDKDHSVMKLAVLDKSLPDRPIMSFLVSHMSMAMITKLAGAPAVSPDIAVSYRGNDVTVDFHQALAHSKLADVELMGYHLLDYLVIKSVTTQPGSMEFQTNLNVPPQVAQMLLNVL